MFKIHLLSSNILLMINLKQKIQNILILYLKNKTIINIMDSKWWYNYSIKMPANYSGVAIWIHSRNPLFIHDITL